METRLEASGATLRVARLGKDRAGTVTRGPTDRRRVIAPRPSEHTHALLFALTSHRMGISRTCVDGHGSRRRARHRNVHLLWRWKSHRATESRGADRGLSWHSPAKRPIASPTAGHADGASHSPGGAARTVANDHDPCDARSRPRTVGASVPRSRRAQQAHASTVGGDSRCARTGNAQGSGGDRVSGGAQESGGDHCRGHSPLRAVTQRPVTPWP